jgi:hypothetical protein
MPYSVNIIWSYSWVESIDVVANSLDEAILVVSERDDLMPSGPEYNDLSHNATWEIDDYQPDEPEGA